jgi:hypothetical protein
MKPHVAAVIFIVLATFCAACGGGGSGESSSGVVLPTPTPTSGSNVQPINVNLGPEGDYVNGVFTSVTVCIPGTSNCQTVNDILVDTGSFGLRILSPELTISLPQQTQDGNPVAECAQFAEGFTWGPVVTADVEIAGETAHNVPIQIVGESGFPSPPNACTNTGLPPIDTLKELGATGILGIGPLVQDCGSACTTTGATNPDFYYTCASSTCSVTAQSLEAQVQNPVPLFSSDNNGLLVSLPAVGPDGAATVSGSLIFGIGTRSNNALGDAQIYTPDSLGDLTVVYEGVAYTDSYLDTGTNGIFFLTPGLTGIPECSDKPGFYCPTESLTLTAENEGGNGQTGTVTFYVANADSLFATGNAAFDNLGGTNPGAFDWGVPFFMGRNVFVAIAGQETPGGPGPYWAY